MATVVLAGTLDTKGGEYVFIRDKILSLNFECKVLLVDVGIRSTSETVPHGDIASSEIVVAAGEKYENLTHLAKPDALDLMSKGLTQVLQDLHAKGNLHGVMGVGGGCGSTILSKAFQQLPLGLPKLLVSTIVATGSARPLIGLTDMTIMFSVTDMPGRVNQFNQQILTNAAAAIGSMTTNYAANHKSDSTHIHLPIATKRSKPRIVASMIGLTQPCVLAAEALLIKLGYEVIIFHSVGIGGDIMEYLIESGTVDGVLDVTLTEVIHAMIPGGVLSSGPQRLETAGRLGIPQVVSLGTLDGFTFGDKAAIPNEYRTRKMFVNNAKFTTVRASSEECSRVGEIVAKKLNASQGPVTLIIPRKGLSHLSEPGGPLEDPVADESLFESIRTHIDPKKVCLIQRDEHINQPEFAAALVDALHEQLKYY